MQFRSAGAAAAIVAALIAPSACADASAESGETRPATVASDPVEATIYCYGNYARNGPLTGAIDVTVTIGADGRATSATTAAGAAERLASAAQCVGTRVQYRPALAHGQPVAGRVILPVEFPNLPTVRGELQRVVEYCHAPWSESEVWLGTKQSGDMDARVGAADSRALEGSVNLVARVGTDGKIKEYELPGGVLPWMQDAVKCVSERLEFFPARLRTLLVESWVLVPLTFGLSSEQHLGAEITPPKPRSDEATILAAYRKCYPAGETAMSTIAYRITVAKTGRIRRAEVLESSGNAALDEAGACILRSLAFVAARRNGRAVEATLNWPILVRPPG